MLELAGRHTAKLAEFAADLQFRDIPPAIVEHVKRVTLNQIGATLSGWVAGPGVEVFQVFKEFGGVEAASVIGSSVRLPTPAAAAINSTLAWGPMNDDTHVGSLFHTGHGSVHPALSEAEARKASGKDLIRAIVASNEVGIRIARSVSPEHDNHFSTSKLGFWSELRGPFCSSVACGKIMGLSALEMRHAISIAASSTSGLQELGECAPVSGTVYAWEAGKAAINGMLAAKLAAAGMAAGAQPLEGKFGWVHVYTWGHGRPEWLTEGLGKVFETGSIQIKTRCNSSMVHPIIDAAYELVREYAIIADQIEKVVVRGQGWLQQYLWRLEPRTYQDAIFSLPFSIALVILEPAPMTYPDQIIQHLGDPAMLALMSKFELQVDDAVKFSAEMPGTISIRMSDGRAYEKSTAGTVRGTYPQNPLEPGELEDKFRRLGRQVLSRHQLDEAIHLIANLEHLDDVAALAGLLRKQI